MVDLARARRAIRAEFVTAVTDGGFIGGLVRCNWPPPSEVVRGDCVIAGYRWGPRRAGTCACGCGGSGPTRVCTSRRSRSLTPVLACWAVMWLLDPLLGRRDTPPGGLRHARTRSTLALDPRSRSDPGDAATGTTVLFGDPDADAQDIRGSLSLYPRTFMGPPHHRRFATDVTAFLQTPGAA